VYDGSPLSGIYAAGEIAGFGGGGEEKSSPVEGPIALRTGKPLKSGLSAVWTIWG